MRARCCQLVFALTATIPGVVRAQVLDRVPPGTRLDTVASSLRLPWGMAFAPDGRIFVSERSGAIRVISHGRLQPTPWATLDVASDAAGLLGIALSPDFGRTRAMYVSGSVRLGNGALENRLYRITDSAGRGVRQTVLLRGVVSAPSHAGSAVAFGPDAMLYVTYGDARLPAVSSNPANLGGKILRLTPDGTVPRDNPTPGSPVYALGVRNPQGLAWDPATRTLFSTDHGPTNWPWEGGRADHDELNVIVAGGNYGWPAAVGAARDDRYRDPIHDWTPAIAPAGLAYYDGPYAPWRGSLLVGALRGRTLRRLTVSRNAGDHWRVTGEEDVIVAGAVGRVRGVFVAPNGDIYLTTSNSAGGQPSVEPLDRVLRLVLPSSGGGSR